MELSLNQRIWSNDRLTGMRFPCFRIRQPRSHFHFSRLDSLFHPSFSSSTKKILHKSLLSSAAFFLVLLGYFRGGNLKTAHVVKGRCEIHFHNFYALKLLRSILPPELKPCCVLLEVLFFLIRIARIEGMSRKIVVAYLHDAAFSADLQSDPASWCYSQTFITELSSMQLQVAISVHSSSNSIIEVEHNVPPAKKSHPLSKKIFQSKNTAFLSTSPSPH